MSRSFVIQATCFTRPRREIELFTLAKIRISSRGGKMRASALLATAPIREMRSPRSGTIRATTAIYIVCVGEWGKVQVQHNI